MRRALFSLGLLGCSAGGGPADPPSGDQADLEASEARPSPSLDGPDLLAVRADQPAKHAILVVIDTLRADRQASASTPTLDSLARDGARVPRAWAAGTWTVPSVVSLFTGMSVREHGYDEPTGQLGRYPALPPHRSLAEALSEQGFVTDALYCNPYLAEDMGFDRGFSTWRRSADPSLARQFTRQVQEGWDDGRRHFAYLHFIGPHSPLRPSDEARALHRLEDEWFDERGGMNIGAAKRDKPLGAREAYARAYDAVIEDTDARVAEVLQALGPHRADTAIIVTSDHGELLGEHSKVGHGYWVWEPLSHVPLIVDHPHLDGAEESLPHTLGIASVPALITEMLGLDLTWPTSADAALPLVAQREGKLALSPDGRFKGIWHSRNSSAVEVYNLLNNPAEERILSSNQGLPAHRSAWEAATPEGSLGGEAVQLGEDTVEELKELGYLGQDED